MSEKMTRLKSVPLKEEFMALTKNIEQALLLQQFLYWMERVDDFDEMVRELNEFRDKPITIESQHGWIYKRAEDMARELFFNYLPVKSKKNTIYAAADELVAAGYLDRRRNPHPEYQFDRTYQYKPNLKNIRAALKKLGFELQGFKFCDSNPSYSSDGNTYSSERNCVDTELQETSPNSPYGNTYSSDGKAIPEIINRKINNNLSSASVSERSLERYYSDEDDRPQPTAMHERWIDEGLFKKTQNKYGISDVDMAHGHLAFVERHIKLKTKKIIWDDLYDRWFARRVEWQKMNSTKKKKTKQKEKKPTKYVSPIEKEAQKTEKEAEQERQRQEQAALDREAKRANMTPEEKIKDDIAMRLFEQNEIIAGHIVTNSEIQYEDTDSLAIKLSTEVVGRSHAFQSREVIKSVVESLELKLGRIEFV